MLKAQDAGLSITISGAIESNVDYWLYVPTLSQSIGIVGEKNLLDAIEKHRVQPKRDTIGYAIEQIIDLGYPPDLDSASWVTHKDKLRQILENLLTK